MADSGLYGEIHVAVMHSLIGQLRPQMLKGSPNTSQHCATPPQELFRSVVLYASKAVSFLPIASDGSGRSEIDVGVV